MSIWKASVTALVAVAGIIGVSSATLAQAAQDRGWYLGGSIGQATAKAFCDTGGVTGLSVTSCDDKNTSWKLFAGHKFTRNFAAELTWIKFDDFSASATFTGIPFTASADGNAFGIAGVGIWPVTQQFSLFGKLGILRTEAEGTATVGGSTITLGDNETEAHYGLGATYDFTRNWALRGEWERADKSEIDMLSLGVQFKF